MSDGGEEWVRYHARKIIEDAEDAPCFAGFELGMVARGLMFESMAHYARGLRSEQEAIRQIRAFLDRWEGAS